MFRYILKNYRNLKYAHSQKHKVEKEGSLLHAFHQTKTVFIHIPKTAGISLLKAIYGKVSLESHRTYEFNNLILGITKNQYFSFSFVRNPFYRLYSIYMFLQKGGINKLDETLFQKHLAKYTDFEDFVLNGLNKKTIFQVTHLLPQSYFICNNKGEVLVSFLGRFENLINDVNHLSKKLGKEINLEHLNKNKKRSYKEFYSQEMIEIVNMVYEDDLRIFNYEF